MIKNILIPVDFSQVSNNAIEYVKHLNRKVNCNVLLFHSVKMRVTTDQALETMYTGIFNDTEDLSLNKQMDELANEFSNADISVRKEVRVGVLADDIGNVAAENNIDLIVSGTSGAGTVGGLFFSTNSVTIFEHVTCPVLIIPSNCNFRLIKKIVYATDFQKGDPKELGKICRFAELFDAEVIVLHINTNPLRFTEDKEKLEKIVQTATDEITYKNISYVIKHNESVFDGLDQYMTSTYIDVICMARSEKSFIEKLLFKSNTKEMAFQSRIPLMVVHLDA